PGLVIAMIFTSIPFIVRTVQPVIEDLGSEVEEAAGTLGASRQQIFWRVILPTLMPALLAGASQAFIRSLGEFGAVVMIAGNIPFKTEITSLMIFVRLQEFDYAAAAAIASVVLITSLVLLFGLQLLQARLMKWQRNP
ncbi:MAG: ABC transporter permease subunit, partial [Lautropia sp.]|nr:ABC transporter permease subunit [Lautropia sp.]